MAMWPQISRRHWLVFMNVAIAFFVLIFVSQFQQQNQITTGKRWAETRDETSQEKTFISCSPKRNVVFLKTHKCASSSVQNILMRYAHQKNLTVVLPTDPKTIYLSLRGPFRKRMIAGAPWENFGYNILCHHMVFNQAEIEKIMPPDTTYISIVRNPVSLFESLYEYDKLEEFYKMDIEEYAKATRNVTALKKIRTRGRGTWRNPMMFDFGINPAYFSRTPTSFKVVDEAIKTFESRFDFVMVAENFDESIVILRHIMCWELDDVVSLTVNARMQSYKKNLSEEAISNLQHWHWADQMLYNFFVAKFNKTVEEFGHQRLQLEVEELRKKRQEWFQHCVEETVDAQNLTAFKIWSTKVVGFKIKSNVTNDTCEDLVKPEKYFTNEMRQHQLLRSLAKGFVKLKTVYQMIDLSVLRGKERDAANKMLYNFYKHHIRLKKPNSSRKANNRSIKV